MLYMFRTGPNGKGDIYYVQASGMPTAIKRFEDYGYDLSTCASISPVTSIRQILETYSSDPEEQLTALILAIRTACANVNPDIKNQIIEAYCADHVDAYGILREME